MNMMMTKPQLVFEFDQDQFQQGQTVSGFLAIHGGDQGLTSHQIHLQLCEIAGPKEALPPKHADLAIVEKTMRGQVVVDPNSVYRIPFALDLPINARTSYENSGWGLEVNFDDTHALNRFDAVTVKRGRRMDALAEACVRELDFQEEPVEPGWNPQTGAAILKLTTSGPWRDRARTLELHLIEQPDGALSGQIHIQRKSSNPVERFLFRKTNNLTLDINFPARDLSFTHNGPNYWALARVITQLLARCPHDDTDRPSEGIAA